MKTTIEAELTGDLSSLARDASNPDSYAATVFGDDLRPLMVLACDENFARRLGALFGKNIRIRLVISGTYE